MIKGADKEVHGSVAFWSEGGSAIGMGHVARSLNIALAVIGRGMSARFLVNDDAAVRGRIEDFGVAYRICGSHLAAALETTDGVVVIDTKRDIREDVRGLKDRGRKVVVIDNLCAVDIADKTIIPSAVAYGLPPNDKILAGKEYVIIGEGFRRVREERRRPVYGLPLKVLVTMGGADPFGLTEKVVAAIAGMEGIEATVVLGPAKRITPELDGLKINKPGWMEFVHGVKDMATLMSTVHIAFTAIGTTVYELAYMGVPTVLIANYAEDRETLSALGSTGAFVSLGVGIDVSGEMIRGAVESFKNNGERYASMSGRASALIDGNGASRVAGVIEALINPPSPPFTKGGIKGGLRR
ncbi:MAG: hypothetical protein HZB22_07285 [Deltaproteobacteria bacterium]|nr:hypothetical protein [Deltaproteobacteria bacterium]